MKEKAESSAKEAQRPKTPDGRHLDRQLETDSWRPQTGTGTARRRESATARRLRGLTGVWREDLEPCTKFYQVRRPKRFPFLSCPGRVCNTRGWPCRCPARNGSSAGTKPAQHEGHLHPVHYAGTWYLLLVLQSAAEARFGTCNLLPLKGLADLCIRKRPPPKNLLLLVPPRNTYH